MTQSSASFDKNLEIARRLTTLLVIIPLAILLFGVVGFVVWRLDSDAWAARLGHDGVSAYYRTGEYFERQSRRENDPDAPGSFAGYRGYKILTVEHAKDLYPQARTPEKDRVPWVAVTARVDYRDHRGEKTSGVFLFTVSQDFKTGRWRILDLRPYA